MFTRRFSKASLVSVLVSVGLFVLTGTAARAETSFHRLKRKLHYAEREAGEVLQRVQSVMEEELPGIEIDFDLFDLFDVDSFSAGHRAKGDKTASGGSREPARAEHLTPVHPDNEKGSNVHKHIE